MDGVLNVNKPAGMTSHDVVNRIRRALRSSSQRRTGNMRVKVGHSGTLDPMATGVLLILIGHATRIADLLTRAEKEYRAACVLGISTSTQDAEGSVLSEADASWITREDIQRVLPAFRGEILQTPPMVSAVHHRGQRLYELARKGVEVERKARPVQVYDPELVQFNPGVHPEVELRIICSSGTYVRALCADIGRKLGTGGHMSRLVRTRVGHFRIEDSIPLDRVLSGEISPISIDEALPELPAVDLDAHSARAVIHGNPVPLIRFIPEGLVKMRYPARRVIALARPVIRRGVRVLQPDRVLISAEDI